MTSSTSTVWFRRAAICGALVASLVSCGGDRASRAVPQEGGTAAPSEAYTPVYGTRSGKAREPRGTIRGDFQWAADSPTLPVAASRWEEFLKAHDPPGQEYEDSMHASYVAAAKYELIRVYYLQGRRDEGDALLRRVDPVGWTK